MTAGKVTTQVSGNNEIESNSGFHIAGGRRRAVVNVLANWTYLFVQIASGLILVRIVTDALGQTAYGAWGLIGGMVEYLAISVIGLSHAVPKFVAEYHARGEPKLINDVVTTAATLMLILTLFITASMCLLGYLAPVFLPKIPGELARPVLISSIIMGANLGFGYIARMYVGCVQGLQRYVPASVVLTVWVLAKIGIVLVVFEFFPATLETYALGQIGSTLAFALLAMIAAKWYLPTLKIKLWHVSRNIVRSLFGFFVGMSALTLFNVIVDASMPFIIGKFYGLGAVGAYAGARMLPMTAFALIPTMTHILVPMSSGLQTSVNGRRALGEILVKSSRYCVLLSGVIVLMLVAYGAMLLRLLMPKISGAYPLMVAISLGSMITWAGQAAISMMIGIGRIRAITYAQGIASVVGIILAIAIPKLTGWGVLSVVIATLACVSVKDFLWLPAYAARQTSTPIAHYYIQAYCRPFIVMAIMTAMTICIQRLIPVVSVSVLVAHLVLMFVVFVAASIILVVHPQDREAVLNLVKSKLANIRRGSE